MNSTETATSEKAGYRYKHRSCNDCRKRKLRCSGTRPLCKTCEEAGRDCEWEDTVRKTGPRRGYVRSLEARLAEVESLLSGKEGSRSATHSLPPEEEAGLGVSNDVLLAEEEWPANTTFDIEGSTQLAQDNIVAHQGPGLSASRSDQSFQSAFASLPNSNPSWELDALGLQEPLPSQQAIDELHDIFFAKIYPRTPFIHKGRYLAAMSLPPTSRLRPPVCLSYSLWTLAASVSENYSAVTEQFYLRARKYMDADEIEGRGQGVVTLAHAQATAYLATYEMNKLYFPRAWLNVGRAVRLCHMMNLHRLDDRSELDVKETLSSPMNWLELEERRRVFWAVFVQDRYQSISSGWPMIIDERDITTNLPSSEQDFTSGLPTTPSLSLNNCMTPTGVKNLSLFAANATIAALFGRTLTHLHRKDLPYEGDTSDQDDAFWRRHQYLDTVLLHTLQYLPDDLRIRTGISSPQIVLLHINIQASTICLHQAAIFKAKNSPTPQETTLADSKARCLHATENMMTILRLLDPAVLQNIGPWLPYCLYLAARVLVQTLSEQDQQHNVETAKHLESLGLLMSVLRNMKSKNPYTSSLLMQLERDIAAFGKLNPIGHIVVPMDEVTETLEQEKASAAFSMNPSFGTR
ncbi:fungal-specific transcription factor domain-containing protein [Exophiala viscosa]|uniref:Fungal-specific transcription factor domain-containing protein n=1 Tax=Exophiala viscosa TaxID=2486360 RepID=A0AAN6IC20_9EURO|nr:fungal-specific transcription factor domain-containing protein [Exophiala viscosa]KAI1622825.1 fungal-specific transcription factor domain-containing protein [Exophiala viscosa]